MWIHWNKATNLFHAEEVSRILSFPAPRLNDLVRIDMKDYALCYQFPSSPTQFQNFAMWPLFSCLSIPNIVGVLEAAVSPTRRIIFVSHYPAMLTVATETVRCMVRVYEWSGLYVPVVHARHARELVQEPGPYILGMTSECRTLFTAPSDALVVDLDRNFVLTSSPPTAWNARQRTKIINRITQALNGDVAPSGVPQHLRSAYGGGKLIPAGQIIVMRGEVESVQDPNWWNQNEVMRVMDHACQKLGKNTGIKAVLTGTNKKPLMTKVSMRHLNEIVRERNQYSRDAMEAWQDFINLKGRMDTELAKVSKRNNFLVEELESWKQQFLKFQAFAEQLTKETNELKVKIDGHKRENRRLTSLIDQQKDDINRITVRLSGTEKQRDDALEALVLQQEIAEELERERKRNKKDLSALQHTNATLLRQRDETQRVVLHLRALIDGQAHHMEHIVRSLKDTPETSEFLDAEEELQSPVSGDLSVPAQSERHSPAAIRSMFSMGSRVSSRASTRQSLRSDSHNEGESSSPSETMNTRRHSSKRFSELSMNDVADRHLRDKTDAIAYIIRNISEQCAAAVEGLDLARRADTVSSEGEIVDDFKSPGSVTSDSRASRRLSSKRPLRTLLSPDSMHSSSFSQGASSPILNEDNESDFGGSHADAKSDISASTASSSPTYSSYNEQHRHISQQQQLQNAAQHQKLHSQRSAASTISSGESSKRASSVVPPTPDLVHDRASTSMSIASDGALHLSHHNGGSSAMSGRSSIQSNIGGSADGGPKIVDENDDGPITQGSLDVVPEEPVTKYMLLEDRVAGRRLEG
jgi:hypothetical protein